MSELTEQLVGRISHLLQQTPLQSSRTYEDCTRRASVAVLLRLSHYPDGALHDIEEVVRWCESAKPFVHIFFIKRANNPRDRWSGHVCALQTAVVLLLAVHKAVLITGLCRLRYREVTKKVMRPMNKHASGRQARRLALI